MFQTEAAQVLTSWCSLLRWSLVSRVVTNPSLSLKVFMEGAPRADQWERPVLPLQLWVPGLVPRHNPGGPLRPVSPPRPRRRLPASPRTRAHSLGYLMIRRDAPGGGRSGSIEPVEHGTPQRDGSSGSPPTVHDGEEPASSQRHRLENQDQCKEELWNCILLCVVDSVSYNYYNLIFIIYIYI